MVTVAEEWLDAVKHSAFTGDSESLGDLLPADRAKAFALNHPLVLWASRSGDAATVQLALDASSGRLSDATGASALRTLAELGDLGIGAFQQTLAAIDPERVAALLNDTAVTVLDVAVQSIERSVELEKLIAQAGGCRSDASMEARDAAAARALERTNRRAAAARSQLASIAATPLGRIFFDSDEGAAERGAQRERAAADRASARAAAAQTRLAALARGRHVRRIWQEEGARSDRVARRAARALVARGADAAIYNYATRRGEPGIVVANVEAYTMRRPRDRTARDFTGVLLQQRQRAAPSSSSSTAAAVAIVASPPSRVEAWAAERRASAAGRNIQMEWRRAQSLQRDRNMIAARNAVPTLESVRVKADRSCSGAAAVSVSFPPPAQTELGDAVQMEWRRLARIDRALSTRLDVPRGRM